MGKFFCLSLLLIFAIQSRASEDARSHFHRLVSVDLLRLQAQETAGKTPEEVDQMNADEVALLEQQGDARQVETRRGMRVNTVSQSDAQNVISSIDRHPVVGYYQSLRYQRENVQIGFCFGRATYTHLAMLRMGVNRDSIKKIWAVGPMHAGGISWAFHVATIVRATEGGWWVLDNYPMRMLELNTWMALFKPQNSEFGNLRYYITDPEKFSVSLGKYDRVQMGLGLTAENDWYQHYFVDLLTWMRAPDNIRSLGLPDLRQRQQ